MHLLQKSTRLFCTTLHQKQLQQLALSVYISNKSIISFSKYLHKPQYPKYFPNCYIQQDLANKLILPSYHPQQQQQQQQQQLNKINNLGVMRTILKSNISQQNICIDINSLKKNKVCKKIIDLENNQQYRTTTARILIHDQIVPNLKQKSDIGNYIGKIQKNMQELQKLLEDGLKLGIAYMISNKNYECVQWLKLINKKRKAIHSNILLGQQTKTTTKDTKLEQFIYDHGYKLEHIFLDAYKIDTDNNKIIQTDKLEDNTLYSNQELIYSLNSISFKGKIILEDNMHFLDNLKFMEQILMKNGFQRRNITDKSFASQNDNWFARI